jgi:EAL domain-containing protein (putative c-di-GMP-specific phosphodiesterase class I)
MLMVDPRVTARRLSALAGLGVRIAIDDFGTGYSSISYLREFPVDILKIDKSFVDQLASAAGRNFLDALVHLGKSLGLVTVAEGIEQISQLKHLKAQGCDRGQGYLFSKPVLSPSLYCHRTSNRSSCARTARWERCWPSSMPSAGGAVRAALPEADDVGSRPGSPMATRPGQPG